jgi:type I restriction-modification system DNA methylase subunit
MHNAGFTKDKFDFILTNPPFGSKIAATERPYLGTYTLGNSYDKKGKAKVRNSQSSEVLFIERIYEFLKPAAGKAAIVLPDGILTNPPFGSQIIASERPYLGNYILGNSYDKKGKAKVRNNQNSEVLFIERIYEFLKPATGKAAIVLPDGILTNSSMQYVREYILEKFHLLAVVSLPQAAFAHFGAGVKASVIFVRKRGLNETPSNEEPIFMAAPEKIGYDATGRANDLSQLPEIVKQYERFKEDATSFFV